MKTKQVLEEVRLWTVVLSFVSKVASGDTLTKAEEVADELTAMASPSHRKTLGIQLQAVIEVRRKELIEKKLEILIDVLNNFANQVTRRKENAHTKSYREMLSYAHKISNAELWGPITLNELNYVLTGSDKIPKNPPQNLDTLLDVHLHICLALKKIGESLTLDKLLKMYKIKGLSKFEKENLTSFEIEMRKKLHDPGNAELIRNFLERIKKVIWGFPQDSPD